MLHSITVTNPKGEALELELTNPEKSGLSVRSVEGLGPPQVTVNGQELANTDGMIYTSTRADTRNIVLTLGMVQRDKTSKYGRLSIEESRHLTYRYFPLKKKVTITFKTDTRTVYTTGYVESNEPNIFSKDETADISVVCPDPWLYEVGDSQTIFSGVLSLFEFPFSNESVTEHMIEFGKIRLDTQAYLNYEGTVDTGVVMRLLFFEKVEQITIYNVDTEEWMKIDTKAFHDITKTDIQKGDEIWISTVKNNRYCRLLRDGAYSNLIGCLTRDSDWFQISPGENAFAFTAEHGAENMSITFTYENAYVGV